MRQVKFLECRAGMNGGMTFQPKVWVYQHSYTRRTPDRYEKWFARPTREEAEKALDRRCRRDGGWQDMGQL